MKRVSSTYGGDRGFQGGTGMDRARAVAWSTVAVAALVTLIVLSCLSFTRTTRHPPGRDDADRVASAVLLYFLEHDGSTPPLVDGRHVAPQHLRNYLNIRDGQIGTTTGGAEVIVDFWGSPYVVKEDELGRGHVLVSPGKDRTLGTDDDIWRTCGCAKR